jgi:hypothetical protein
MFPVETLNSNTNTYHVLMFFTPCGVRQLYKEEAMQIVCIERHSSRKTLAQSNRAIPQTAETRSIS